MWRCLALGFLMMPLLFTGEVPGRGNI